MKKWENSHIVKPVSSFTVPRRGQLRDQITNRYSHLKRSYLEDSELKEDGDTLEEKEIL